MQHKATRRHTLFVILAFAGLLLTLPLATFAACRASDISQTSIGMSGAPVAALQECLIEAGFPIPAGVSGYYGQQTKSAVTAFYAAKLSLPSWNGLSFGPKARALLMSMFSTATPQTPESPTPAAQTGKNSPAGYKRAGNEKTLVSYLTQNTANYQTLGFGGLVQQDMNGAAREQSIAAPRAMQSDSGTKSATRVSETTVQVAGIDEPDIVKTDGTHLYISKEGRFYGRPIPMNVRMMSDAIMPNYEDTSATAILDAFPVSELASLGEIKERGELLLVKEKNVLIILAHPTIVAYDVTDRTKPVKKWELKLEENTSLQTARLRDGTLILVTETWLNHAKPCPIVPIMRGATRIAITCADVFVPNRIEPVSAAMTVLTINPTTGTETKKLSFAVDGSVTTVAVFKDNLYLATKSYTAPYDILTSITVDAFKKHLSQTAIAQIQKISGYDISPSGKMNEITAVIERELAQFSADRQLTIQTDVQNEITKEMERRKREVDRTRIVRVSLASLQVAATGDVPGTLLNQFALDEHNGTLRAAVTVSGNGWWGGGESVNDVYTLGLDLKEKGSVRDLGRGERIYAVRFLGDTAYVVTFKQIDPFYVLDLKNPAAPKMVGELKIPGYSAYLEPLPNNRVLGIGREGNGVKISLFNVQNPAKPIEEAKYQIKDSWSEVENNHHAFLHDALHKVFFIPGSSGGYVFSYENGALTLKSAVPGYAVKRAVYLDDYLYIISNDTVTVLDETTWKEVKKVTY